MAVALGWGLLAVDLLTGCGQPVHREDFLSVSSLAYDDQGDLVLGSRGTLIYLGPDRRELWRKDVVADMWILSVAASSSTIVAWENDPTFSGPAFLLDALRPDADLQAVADVRTIALAPDGRLAIQTLSSPPDTRILDPRTGSSIHITSESAHRLAFSPDGRRLYGDLESSPAAPATSRSRLVAFDAETAAELWSTPIRLRNLRLSRDGTTLVGLLADQQRPPTLLTWNAQDGTLIDTFSFPTLGPTSSSSSDALAVSPDGDTIALSVLEGSRADCRTVVLRARAIAYSLPCLYLVALSPDGSLIAGRRSPSFTFDEDTLVFYRSADGTEVERRSLPRPFF